MTARGTAVFTVTRVLALTLFPKVHYREATSESRNEKEEEKSTTKSLGEGPDQILPKMNLL